MSAIDGNHAHELVLKNLVRQVVFPTVTDPELVSEIEYLKDLLWEGVRRLNWERSRGLSPQSLQAVRAPQLPTTTTTLPLASPPDTQPPAVAAAVPPALPARVQVPLSLPPVQRPAKPAAPTTAPKTPPAPHVPVLKAGTDVSSLFSGLLRNSGLGGAVAAQSMRSRNAVPVPQPQGKKTRKKHKKAVSTTTTHEVHEPDPTVSLKGRKGIVKTYQVAQFLLRNGYTLLPKRGGEEVYEGPHGKKVSVPRHGGGGDVLRATLRNILTTVGEHMGGRVYVSRGQLVFVPHATYSPVIHPDTHQ